MIRRALWIWAGMFGLAFANGAIRELLIKKIVGEPAAHQFSALTGALLLGGFVLLTWKRSKITTFKEACIIGSLWFILTVLVETFLLGRWMSHLTWEQVFNTYKLSPAELWPLVLFWIGVLPIVALALRGPAR